MRLAATDPTDAQYIAQARALADGVGIPIEFGDIPIVSRVDDGGAHVLCWLWIKAAAALQTRKETP